MRYFDLSPPWTRRLPLWKSWGLLAVLAVVAVPGRAAPQSLISTEIFRYDCRSEFSSTDLTLFGNGTLRLREGLHDRRTMLLLELDPVELQELLRRLDELDLREIEAFGGELEGEWVGQCVLRLALLDRSPADAAFHRLDSLSLGLQTAVNLGEELAGLVRQRAEFDGLPKGYQPHIGDFLRRADGEIFEVMGFSGDDRAVELAGLDQPILIYVPVEELSAVFLEIVPGRR
jgi:hypothetical protein